MINDFAIFICTHRRPNSQYTYNTLRKCGYTGKIYFVLDDTDDSIQEYINNYGADMLFVFNKQHYIDTTDVASVPPNFKTILYAKNAVEDIAHDLKLKSFIIADDDIFSFRFRLPKDEEHLSSFVLTNADDAIKLYNDFMLECDFASVGICGNVHFIAGRSVFDNEHIQKYRVPYNFVFRNSKYEINWVSSFGEDIITAMEYNKRGYKFLDIPYVQYDAVSPGKAIASGGMSELYNSMSAFTLGSYIYIYNPSAIRISFIKTKWTTSILKNYIYPKIISYQYKKE